MFTTLLSGDISRFRQGPPLNLMGYLLQATRFFGLSCGGFVFSLGSLGWSLVAKPQDGPAKQKKAKKKKNGLGETGWRCGPPSLANSIVCCFGVLWVALELVFRCPYGELSPSPHFRLIFVALLQFGVASSSAVPDP